MVEQGKMAMTSSSSAAAAKQSASPVSYHPYPQPLARYEDVVACGKLFMDTPRKLHATMGTKVMIPVIGGKDLDLHHLLVEVTSRGGIGRAKGWTEYADASHKVPTVSASCHDMDSFALPITNVQETPLQPRMDTTQSLPGGVNMLTMLLKLKRKANRSL